MSFSQFLTILKARRWVALLVLAVTVGTTVVVSALLPARWSASAAVLVDSKGPDPITGLLLPAQMLPGYLATQVDVIQSRNVALKVVERLGLDRSEVARQEWRDDTGGRGSLKVWLADLLLKKLDVKPARESSVVHIGFSGTDPQFAAAVANAFAQAYIETNLELRVEPARQSAKWFSERAPGAAHRGRGLGGQARGLPAAEGHRLARRAARHRERAARAVQRAALAGHRADRRRRVAPAPGGRGAGARRGARLGSREVVGNTLVQSLKAELTRKEGQLQDLSIRYGTNHPQYRAAAAEVQSTRQKISGAMADVVASLGNNMRIAQRREAELRSQVGTQKTRVLALKKERDELAALMREAENAQRAFDATTQRYTQTSLESQATQTNIAVLSPAVEPIEPSFPKWPLNIAARRLPRRAARRGRRAADGDARPARARRRRRHRRAPGAAAGDAAARARPARARHAPAPHRPERAA
ncbi:MAG: Wzz/FepE/Etk N-terminal domain-containing protein [Burkholderiales bacterium]|nr:Wzz/FepE/Etk N-terminal domain-containing protein [Burkholderiales bacterium]